MDGPFPNGPLIASIQPRILKLFQVQAGRLNIGAAQLIKAVPDLGAVVTVLSRSPIKPLDPGEAGTTGDGSDYDDFVGTVVEPAIHS